MPVERPPYQEAADFPARAAPALRVERIVVRPDRVCCDVRVADSARRNTDGRIARRALERFPSLARHTCVNGGGKVFGELIANTPLPHLMEHAAIDIMCSRAEDDRSFLGTTEWLDWEGGLARVSLTYADDLACLAAINEAVAFVNDVAR